MGIGFRLLLSIVILNACSGGQRTVPSSDNGSVKMSSCFSFDESEISYDDAIQFLEVFASSQNMNSLNEKTMGILRYHMQTTDAEVTITYSRMKRFGNLIEVFRKDENGRMIENKFTKFIEQRSDLNLKGCGNYWSEIPLNWKIN